MSISKRAKKLLAQPSSIVEGHIMCASDPFSINNPKGYINFGTAENYLMDQEILSKLNTSVTLNVQDIHYGPQDGHPDLRENFKIFMQTYLGITEVQNDNIVVQTGVSSICEALSFSLFEENDYVMLATPYYPGFDHDFKKRFKVNFLECELKASENYRHEIEVFKNAYSNFDQKEKVKAILICHPHNPTGERLSDSFLKEITDFAKINQLQIISDEIYALSNFGEVKHNSLFEYAKKQGVNSHFLYGMAKDFALGGFKVGFYYSEDQESVDMMKALSYFYPVSSHTQRVMSHFFSDQDFLKKFVEENQKRLLATKEYIIKQCPHLKFLDFESGLFMLLDLSHQCRSLDDEDKIFKYFLNELKINISKGSEMGHKEPGFFRVCFAQDKSSVEEFCTRVKNFKGLTNE